MMQMQGSSVLTVLAACPEAGLSISTSTTSPSISSLSSLIRTPMALRNDCGGGAGWEVGGGCIAWVGGKATSGRW